MSSLLRFFFYCISFMAVLTFAENVLHRSHEGFGKRESGTAFLEHFHWFLNVKASVSITVYDAMACALECLRHRFCFSFNFAVSPSKRHDCQLLQEDKYTFSDRFEPSQFYNHYSMASPCEYNPCRNGATCRPQQYRSNGFFCIQSPGKIEQGAHWIKLNRDVVCFGAKNDSYGTFIITSRGTITALKLVYISGFVTCNNEKHPYGSHWACQKGSKIATLVTNSKKEVIFPQNYQNQAYTLPGYHENSSELVFSRLFPPLRAAAGDEYMIWYHEDFMNRSEENNDGHTCVDVYAL